MKHFGWILYPLLLGAVCVGPLPGTWVSLGDSYALIYTDPLAAQSGCETLEIGEAGSFALAWNRGIEAVVAELSVATGPVVVVLHAGTNDERAAAPWGSPPWVVADRVEELVTSLLAIRPDLVVVQPHYVGGLSEVEFFDYLLISDPRYQVIEWSDGLMAAFGYPLWPDNPHLADPNHPSAMGAAKLVDELIRVSPLAASGRCW